MKTNNLLLKLSDQELTDLNNGWFNYIYATGEKISRLEYIRTAIAFMNRNVKEIAQGIAQVKE